MRNERTRIRILRANAVFLALGSLGGLRMDILGAFFAAGPASKLIAAVPGSAIGFIEAHGLALIISVLLWRAEPLRSWHLTAAAVHLLLGTANLVFWQFFVIADALLAGYVTTSLHWLFVTLELAAAAAPPSRERALLAKAA